jgi:hypothetical protein
VLSPQQIDRMIETRIEQGRMVRADAIGRALRVVSEARDTVLRQSLEATGQSATFTGKQWNATSGGRTRDDHANSNGQRRRLDDTFDVGGEQLMKPGDGSARQSVNCRCVPTYEFFDTPEQLAE